MCSLPWRASERASSSAGSTPSAMTPPSDELSARHRLQEPLEFAVQNTQRVGLGEVDQVRRGRSRELRQDAGRLGE